MIEFVFYIKKQNKKKKNENTWYFEKLESCQAFYLIVLFWLNKNKWT